MNTRYSVKRHPVKPTACLTALSKENGEGQTRLLAWRATRVDALRNL